MLARGGAALLVAGSLAFAWWEARQRSNLQVKELQCQVELADKQSTADRLGDLLEQRNEYIRELEGLLDSSDLFDRVFGSGVLPSGPRSND